jgi:hypothetical protein
LITCHTVEILYGMGYKTIKAEELEQRVTAYWIPTDYDAAAARATLDGLVRRWPGFVRLTVDDQTQVLTSVDYRFQSGAYQTIWTTEQTPTEVIRRTTEPASFQEMWQTYKGWDDYLSYAQQRYITESTNFLVAVEEYRQSPSVPKQLELYARFIEADAPEQVNIDSDVVQAIEARADGGADVFDDAQRFIMNLLSQDFASFLTWYRAQPLS